MMVAAIGIATTTTRAQAISSVSTAALRSQANRRIGGCATRPIHSRRESTKLAAAGHCIEVMRNPIGIFFVFTSMLVLGCDKPVDEPGGEIEYEYAPHPYLSCAVPPDWSDGEAHPLPMDPGCSEPGSGCGHITINHGPTWSFCHVGCVDDSDCLAWDPGGSMMSCHVNSCHWRCDEEHPCSSDLECVYEPGIELGYCWAAELPAL